MSWITLASRLVKRYCAGMRRSLQQLQDARLRHALVAIPAILRPPQLCGSIDVARTWSAGYARLSPVHGQACHSTVPSAVSPHPHNRLFLLERTTWLVLRLLSTSCCGTWRSCVSSAAPDTTLCRP